MMCSSRRCARIGKLPVYAGRDRAENASKRAPKPSSSLYRDERTTATGLTFASA